MSKDPDDITLRILVTLAILGLTIEFADYIIYIIGCIIDDILIISHWLESW